MNPFQRVCHFPGTWFLGRKDLLAKCVAKFKRANGPVSFPYLPKTYLLPDERDELIADWKQSECRSCFILKPRASARGLGIKLVCV